MNRLIGFAILILAMAGCKGVKDAAVDSNAVNSPDTSYGAVQVIKNTASSNMLPQAVAYQTNGDYNNNVPIMLNDAHNAIVSYPGPGDVSPTNSKPIELGEGWLLDRRGGIGKNTAFLKYTYAEYAALKQVPSQETLMDNIIPEAKVTAVKVLPIKLNQALQDPDKARQYLSQQ